ncbi:probable cytochrome P450 6a14 [Anabrus simplex]|uniref:probable cytochrome P450 6a14 n=1 Tax=Anabrus simplex TaxID=316456 RepID=UPI0035A2DB1F
MGLVFGSFLVDVLALVGVLFGWLAWYFNSNFGYWKKRGVPYAKPEPFFGNFREIFTVRKNLGEGFQNIYNQLEGHRFGGAFRFRYPIVVIRDPELIKQILVKDFLHFQGRGLKVDPENDPLSQHLFSLSGPIWRALRTKLTPTFTSGKMKMMFQLMEECSVQLDKYISECNDKSDILEMKEVLAKFTTDIIGTCAFGLHCSSMDDENSEFRQMGRRVFETSTLVAMKRLVTGIVPQLSTVLKLSLIDKKVTNFFLKIVKETVEYREKNNIKRNDFLQLLIQLKNQGKIEDHHHDSTNHENGDVNDHADDDKLELTDTLMAAQVFVFFIAGFETSSTTMSFALYELALNPDIQARLREEVDNTLEEYDGKITYDALQKMEYLDRVIAESLRKYPPVPNLLRKCSKEYTIPGTDVKIEKDILTVTPVFAIHRDPKYYPDPDRFDPDRFTPENKAKRHHYTYLPFGEGPRNCIGMRFGLLQSKIGLFTLLSKYEFSVCEQTEIPLKFNPKSPVTSGVSGITLRVVKRT